MYCFANLKAPKIKGGEVEFREIYNVPLHPVKTFQSLADLAIQEFGNPGAIKNIEENQARTAAMLQAADIVANRIAIQLSQETVIL